MCSYCFVIHMHVFCVLKCLNGLQVKQAVIWALQSGYRHIDCAPIYANEPEIGEAFQEMLGPDKVSIARIFVVWHKL